MLESSSSLKGLCKVMPIQSISETEKMGRKPLEIMELSYNNPQVLNSISHSSQCEVGQGCGHGAESEDLKNQSGFCIPQ